MGIGQGEGGIEDTTVLGEALAHLCKCKCQRQAPGIPRTQGLIGRVCGASSEALVPSQPGPSALCHSQSAPLRVPPTDA